MSTFSGLSTGLTGLQAARRGLDVTGQNISNANTDGYTRQRVEQASIGAPTTPALWATYQGAGSGVDVVAISRLSDEFLTARDRAESSTLGQLTGRQTTMSGIESVLGEPGDTGIASQLSDLWSAWHDVANRPGDLASRSQLLARTATVADSIRGAYTKLDTQWSATREQLSVAVDQVNTTAANVAELNQAILRSSQAGIPANELKDKRDQLIDSLAQATGAVAKPAADGTIDVYLGGVALVRGNQASALSVTGASTMTDLRSGATPAPAIVWASSGSPASVSGATGAQVEALGVTIPSYAASLDAFAASLRDTVNTAHTAGYDLDGNPGTAMFSATATAKDITSLITDPRKVAASSTAPNPSPSLDGSNASAMGDLGRAATSPDAVYRQLVVDVGNAAQTANRRVDIQSSVASDAAAKRESAAGVNTDEEMVNLLSYQRAYEASSRVITSIDDTLDTLINHTGLVGR